MAIRRFLHERIAALNKSDSWMEWGDYAVPAVLGGSVGEDYKVLRGSAAIFDCSGFSQYHLRGMNAAAMLNYVVTRDVTVLKAGRVIYAPWCDPNGKVRLDGTVFRFADDWFMVCSEPDFNWLKRWAGEFQVEIVNRRGLDVVIAIQGPESCRVLENVSEVDVRSLSFFGLATGRVAGVPAAVSRTGFSGDLGFEVWTEGNNGMRVWDALVAAGRPVGARPCGMRCLDVARVEAGLIFAGTEYTPAAVAGPDAETCYPSEIGLEWAVDWSKSDFLGSDALRKVSETGGGATLLTGVIVDTHPRTDVRSPAHGEAGLEEVAHGPVAIYEPGTSALIGRISSRVSSPLLGRYIALARVDRRVLASGRVVELDGFFGQGPGRTTGRLADLPFVSFERTRALLKRPT